MKNKLLLTPKGQSQWEVAKNYKTKFGTIPKGFVTNLASVPKILWWLLPPYGKYTEAVVWHDYCYSKVDTKRKQDDKQFKILMLDNGTKLWKVNVMYLGVRIFGKKYKVKK